MAVNIFIMSQGIIGNKMKDFFFFTFQGVTEPLIEDWFRIKDGSNFVSKLRISILFLKIYFTK